MFSLGPRIALGLSRPTARLRTFLKPGLKFLPGADQLNAIESAKDLLVKDHLRAVPDEAAAITSASAWLADEPPDDTQYDMGADTSGFVTSAVTGQCGADTGKCSSTLPRIFPCASSRGIPSSMRARGFCVLAGTS